MNDSQLADDDDLGASQDDILVPDMASLERDDIDPDEFFPEDMVSLELDPEIAPAVVRVLPQQPDEFTCCRCFLVAHRSQIAGTAGTGTYCRDCD